MNLTDWEQGNLVYLALKAGGFINKKEDESTQQLGTILHIGFDHLLSTKPSENQNGVNLMICVFKELGLNPALEVDGCIGNETRLAVEKFKKLSRGEG